MNPGCAGAPEPSGSDVWPTIQVEPWPRVSMTKWAKPAAAHRTR